MKLVTVTDEQGEIVVINPAFILSVRSRPKGAGCTVRFSNGTGLPVIEEAASVIKQLTAVGDFESYR